MSDTVGILLKVETDLAQLASVSKAIKAIGGLAAEAVEQVNTLGVAIKGAFDGSPAARLSRELTALTSVTREMANATGRAGTEFKAAFGSSVTNVARESRAEIHRIAEAASSIPGPIHEATQATNGMGDAIRNAGAVLGVYFSGATIARGLDQLIGGGVRYNAVIEQQQIAFGTLLESAAAEERMRALTTFAAATPYELPEIVQASKLLQAFTGDALAVGEGLTLVGDAAAAVGAPLEATALWLGRLFSALRSGQPVGEALQNLTQLGLISGEVRDRITALQGRTLSLNEAMEAMAQSFGRYTGAMSAQSKTFNGQLSTLTDNVRTLTGELTKPLFERLSSGMASANARMSETREMLQGIANAIRDLTQWAALAAAGIAGVGAGAIAIQGGGMMLGSIIAAKFATAVAASPVWLSVGGLVAAGILAGVGTYRASASAVGALNDQSRAEAGEDARLVSIRQRLLTSRTQEEVESAGRIATRLASGYRIEARTATNDGGLFGVDGEKDRLTGMAEAYERLADLAEKRGAAIIAAAAAEAAANAAAAAAAREEAARAERLAAETKAAKETSAELAKQAEALGKRLELAIFSAATEDQKLKILEDQEALAHRRHADAIDAARLAQNEAAADAADLRVTLELLEIESRRTAIVKQRAEAKEREMIAARKEAAEAEAREKRAEIAQIEGNRLLTQAEQRARLYAVYQREAADLPNRISQTRSALEVEQQARPGGAKAAQLSGELSGLMERQAVGLPADMARTRPLSLGEDIAAQLTALRDGFETVAGSVRNVMGSAIDGISTGIQGLIKGTMTWGEALANIALTITNSIIKAIADMFAQWLVGLAVRAAVGKALAASAVAASVPMALAASAVWATPATLATIATLGGAAAGAPPAIASSIGITKATSLAMFSEGGYTGAGGRDEPAGIVHRGEIVWSQDNIRAAGGVEAVERMRVSGGGFMPSTVVSGVSSTAAAPTTAGASAAAPVINMAFFGDDRTAAQKWAESLEGQSYLVDVVQRNLHRISGT